MVSRLPKCCFDPTVNETNAAGTPESRKRLEIGLFPALPGRLFGYEAVKGGKMRTLAVVLVGLAAFLSAGIAPVSAAESPAAGKALAEHWCASCHLVSPEQASATTEAPPFATIAERPLAEIEALDTFLAAPHPPMPPVNLTRQEIRDVLAYIASLK
jgi:mono/diheme cytochrome c family protein